MTKKDGSKWTKALAQAFAFVLCIFAPGVLRAGGSAGDIAQNVGREVFGQAQNQVTVTVDGVTTILEPGEDASGTGWFFDGPSGELSITGAGKTYTLEGRNTVGGVLLGVKAACTIVAHNLVLDASSRHDPLALLTISANAVIDVTGASSLTGTTGYPTVLVEGSAQPVFRGNAALELFTPEPFFLFGADNERIVFIDTAGNDIHPHLGSHAMESGVAFRSSRTDERVWLVRVPGSFAPGAAVAWSGLDADYAPACTTADSDGNAWLWLPDGAYSFSSQTDADEKDWVVRVVGAHRDARPFVQTGLMINEIDAGHAAGPGWYWDEDHTVFLTNAGPFTVSGSTTAGVGITASNDCAVTLSDLSMDFSAKPGAHAICVVPGASVDFTLVGESMLKTPSGGCAALQVPEGASATIVGEGSLDAIVGTEADTAPNSAGVDGGAGIGGGNGQKAGTITFLGGTVTARSYCNASGIGGGTGGEGGVVEVAGGTVDAWGFRSGIGGGYRASGGTTTISSGRVTAIGEKGAGIGAGNGGTSANDGGNTVISGGIVTASSNGYGAGIGGAGYAHAGQVTISGGTVAASPGFAGFGIGAEDTSSGDKVEISGGSVRVGGVTSPQASCGNSSRYSVTVAGFDPNARVTLDGLDDREVDSYGDNDLYADGSGKIYLWLPNGDHRFVANVGESRETYRAVVLGANANASVWRAGVTVNGVDVSALAGDGWVYESGRTLALTNAAMSYALAGTNTEGHVRMAARAGCTVELHDLTLAIPADEASFAFCVSSPDMVSFVLYGTNSLTSGKDNSAIEVNGIMAASISGDGTLHATGGARASGIGGGYQSGSGTVSILGGTILATGGEGGAGIGGGYGRPGGTTTISNATVVAQGGASGAGIGGGGTIANTMIYGNGGDGGNITIYSGHVTATGGVYAAGIGGGAARNRAGGYVSGNGGTIRIYGGEILAQGGTDGGAGIGGSSGSNAPSGNGGDIAILGGEVEARAGDYNDDRGDGGGAGIGGGDYADGGTIVISNAVVKATGAKFGAGIGGGRSHDGNVTILGGIVTAKGGRSSAGIGGGQSGSGDRITIRDGTVTATGGDGGAGIGGGYGDRSAHTSGGTITIEGGTVMAMAGYQAAGIGGGTFGDGGDIKIKGGVVMASGDQFGAGIGGGSQGSVTSINITGGRITATSQSYAAAIGGGNGGSGGTIRIEGGTVEARADTIYNPGSHATADIGNGKGGSGGSVTITGGSVHDARVGTVTPEPTDGSARVWRVDVGGLPANTPVQVAIQHSTSGAAYGTESIIADADGKIYIWLPDGTYDFTVAREGGEPAEYVAHVAGDNVEAHPYAPLGFCVDGVDIGHYVGDTWYFEASTCSVKLTDERDYLLSGKAAQTGRLSRIGFDKLNGGKTIVSNLVVNLTYGTGEEPGREGPPIAILASRGSTMMLVGTNTLTAASTYPAVYVGPDSAIIIDTQSDGRLEAHGGHGAAGIGGGRGLGYSRDSGWIMIDGGTIVATGGDYAAGIGAGEYGIPSQVMIGGGLVTATGGKEGAGIGGASFSPSDTRSVSRPVDVYITGGTIVATGGDYAAGIGGGRYGGGGVIEIFRGDVTACGGAGAAGIGGGSNLGRSSANPPDYAGSGARFILRGGTVSATGGQYAPGVGMGYCGQSPGQFSCYGGTIAAQGGESGAGIGGAREGPGGVVEIAGGVVTAMGGTEGAGIGGGYNGDCGTVRVAGGIVYATGGSLAAGIGCGKYGSGGSINIAGGTVYPKAGTSSGGILPRDIGHGANPDYLAFPNPCTNTFDGGAIYVDADRVVAAATNQYGLAVFPVDFDIGLPTNKVVSIELLFQGYLGSGHERSFTEYGAKDLYANERGVLRLWLPATAPSVFTATITMEDGSVHYFVFRIWEDGSVTQGDYLVVNGEFVTDRADASGTGWTYRKDTGIVLLTGDATVEGISTNGAHRLLVKRGAASQVTLQELDLRARSGSYASAIVVSNDCTLSLAPDLTNRIVATGQYAAGIEVASGAALTISGSGLLDVRGGRFSAGIGSRGSGFVKPGKIAIKSGTVIAEGGERAAGIGGGSMCTLAVDNISISGGMVTATGGSQAAGIGSGYVGGSSGNKKIPDGAVRITGGTVISTKGASGDSDLVSSANVVSAGDGSRALVITGGSVHPGSLTRTTTYVKPQPVDAAGTQLRYWLFTGMEPGTAFANLTVDGLADGYGANDIVADATGSVCLWLPVTNGVHILCVDGKYFTGGGSTNNVFDAFSGSDLPPDGKDDGINGFWRVTVSDLEPDVPVSTDVRDLAGDSVNIIMDKANRNGDYCFFAMDGYYEFIVNGLGYYAIVEGAPTTAQLLPIGITVNGVDVAAGSGDGWAFSMNSCTISLSGAGPFEISGSREDIAIRADADCAVKLSDLVITNSTLALSPFDCGSHTVTMSLSGTNRLVFAVPGDVSGEPGVCAAGGASLTIDDVRPSGAEPSVLVAEGGCYAAGIGGGYGGAGGTIGISGGVVSATGGLNAAGIGGGYHGDGGRITISGGDVTATAGNQGAGIGGGYHGDGGSITISGGSATATGGYQGAGIGGGYDGAGGTIEISGGVVSATGDYYAAGIGGGGVYENAGASAGSITISGGQVTAVSQNGGAGIGGGRRANGGSVAIRGGTVVARRKDDYNAPAIGRGADGSVDSVVFTGGAVYTTAAHVSPAATNDTVGVLVRPVDLDLGTPSARVESLVIDTPPLAYGTKDLYTDASGVLRLWLPDGFWLLDLKLEGGDTERWAAEVCGNYAVAFPYRPLPDPVGFTVNGTDVGETTGEGWHYDVDRGAVSLYGAGPFELSGTLNNAAVAVETGCAVTLSNAVVDASAVTDAGAINLASGVTVALSIIGENAATGGVGRAGITVPAGATLTIDKSNLSTLQPFNLSTLSAVGGEGAAGIGGDENAQAGTIRIQGGTVAATGGENGAGIGGGRYDGDQECSIEISGGLVTATAGEGAFAIGAGVKDGSFSFYFGHVAISGGTIFPVYQREYGIGSMGTARVQIVGGSLLARGNTIHMNPGVCPVDFNLGVPDTPVTATIPVKNGNATVEYGMNDVRTDANGVIRLWLPLGNSIVTVNGDYWMVSVTYDRATAEPWVSHLTVNGVGVSAFSGEGWTFDFATMAVHLTNSGPFTVSGEEPGASVFVESSCDVVLTNVTLATGAAGLAALDFAAGVTATLELAGTNSLASGRNQAGLAIAETASLVIRGDGFLSAAGGENGAGIGGEDRANCGSLTIEGGVIEARGGFLGAGIGGGAGRGCGTIRIEGGEVVAVGGEGAPGIGDGDYETYSYSHCGTVEISGGVVTARGGDSGAGIGGNMTAFNWGKVAKVVVSGGVVTATGGQYGAGIGGSFSSSADVTISGGVVTATGGQYGAGIGSGKGDLGAASAGTVKISGGIVSATGGEGACGVGGGYLSGDGRVEISGGTVVATAGPGGERCLDVGFVGPDGVAGGVAFTGGSILADQAKVKPAATNAVGASVWRVDVAVQNPDPERAVTVAGLADYGVTDIYPDENGDIHLWLPDGIYYFEVDGTAVHEEVDGSSVFIPLGVTVDGVDVANRSGPNWMMDDDKRVIITAPCVVSGTNTLDGVSIRLETSEEVLFSNACVRSGTGLKVAAGTSAAVRGVGRNVIAPIYYSHFLEEGASLAVAGGTFEFGNYDPFAILGGSVSGIGTYYGSPTNAAGATMWCADLKGFGPGEAVGPIQGLPDYYDTSEIFADDAGKVHLWLPEGTYVATNAADGAKWTIRVGPDGKNTVVAWNDDFTVNGVNIGELAGDGWNFATNTLVISGASGIDRYTLRGTNTLGGVCVVVAADSTVELDGVSLQSRKPLALGRGVTATVLLSGPGNRLVATNSSYAALYVPDGASVTITNATTDARLLAKGSDYGAGIGGDDSNARPGTITIAGGFIEAYSGERGQGYGAGIGGGADGKSSRLIRITGGRVFAYGGANYERAGAAIGGGGTYTDSDGRIEISGGTVYACGGFLGEEIFGADIGDGTSHGAAYENANAVVITGGSVVLAHFDSEKERFTQSKCTVTNMAHDASGRVLHAVIIPGLTPDAPVAPLAVRCTSGVLESEYGANDLYADADGCLCLWLPNGSYAFSVGGTGYSATVADDSVVAERVGIERLVITSITVAGDCVTLVVSAEPESLAPYASELCVRASETLPVSKGEVVDASDVVATPNPDGTATIKVKRADGDMRMLYRVETR